MKLRLAFLTVFLIAACGLGYQLIAGSVSSYLLGDSVTWFSLSIGIYLFALGVGSFLSRYVEEGLVERFVQVELAVSIAGGFSAALLMVAFASDLWFRPVLIGLIVLVGTLVGIEIPLLMRILKGELSFKDLVAKVLSFDYVGSLVVAVVFPLLLVPRLGLVRSALVLGLLNAAVALFSTWLFETRLRHPLWLRLQAGTATLALVLGLVFAGEITDLAEHDFYLGEIVHAENSAYQRIVVTTTHDEFQLFLNGALQFSSGDEYRYHESLVHPAMVSVEEPRRVLVLGGGDGLAVREILKHPAVERVTLVDIDPAMTRLGRTFQPLVELNRHSLSDPRVQVLNEDAMRFLGEDRHRYDVAIVDFPDPHSFALGKLYTRTFYRLLFERLAPDGALSVQSTSPRQAPRSFWCIARTLEAAGFSVRPYHAAVPSFGEWGFLLAAKRKIPIPARVPGGCRYLSQAFLPTLFQLPADIRRPQVEINRLNTQALVRYYEDEYHS